MLGMAVAYSNIMSKTRFYAVSRKSSQISKIVCKFSAKVFSMNVFFSRIFLEEMYVQMRIITLYLGAVYTREGF